MDGMKIEYGVSHENFWAGDEGWDGVREIMVSVSGSDSRLIGEFGIRERQGVDRTFLRIEIYDESWRVFVEVPELFRVLSSDACRSLDEVQSALDAMGASDYTKRDDPRPDGAARRAVKAWQEMRSPANAQAAAEALLVLANHVEEPPF